MYDSIQTLSDHPFDSFISSVDWVVVVVVIFLSFSAVDVVLKCFDWALPDVI